MTEDLDMAPLLEAWLHDTTPPLAESEHVFDTVRSQVRDTSQQHRWWLPSIVRPNAGRTGIDQTGGYQPDLLPAANGHRPPASVRTRSMLNPVRAIAAGAVVFAIGGAVLIAQPFAPQGGGIPGAAADVAPQAEDAVATVVTGNLDARYWLKGAPDPNLAVVGDGMEFRARDVIVPTALNGIEMDDTRLSGDVTFVLNADGWPGGSDGTPAVEWGSVRIENDRGAWDGTYTFAHAHTEEGSDLGPIILRLVGSEDYAGFSAILYGTTATVDDEPSWGEPVQGIVFPGNLPPDRDVGVQD